MKNVSKPMPELTCFKSYDIRGKLGRDMDGDVAERIGRGFAQAMRPRRVVLGRDCRVTSPELAKAVANGLCAQGVDVIDIGECGTEEVYFATAHLGADGGIEVTASHNPIDYNGMKLVGPGARPLTKDEFAAVEDTATKADFAASPHGQVTHTNTRDAYANHIARMLGETTLAPSKLLVNAGNGVGGAAFDAVLAHLSSEQVQITRINHAPDGTFPLGVPNPLLPENQAQTGDAVRANGCDLGVAWDGDCDRCFFFDAQGRFVEGEYVVALLAQAMLAQTPGAAIVHDDRVVLNTRKTIRASGGIPIRARTGHAYMKTEMRRHNAVYGGELSAHHYFRDFMYCDSGIIPVFVMLKLLSRTNKSLEELVTKMRCSVASSGEINFIVNNPSEVMQKLEDHLGPEAQKVDYFDGLNLVFETWRANVRASQTEPYLRLNVESTKGAQDVQTHVDMIKTLIA